MSDDEFALVQFRGRGRGQDELVTAPTLDEIGEFIDEIEGRDR